MSCRRELLGWRRRLFMYDTVQTLAIQMINLNSGFESEPQQALSDQRLQFVLMAYLGRYSEGNKSCHC